MTTASSRTGTLHRPITIPTDTRIAALLRIADHWGGQTPSGVRAAVARHLPHTDTDSAVDYLAETAEHIDNARAIRDGSRPELKYTYLSDEDLRDLDETGQAIAASETAECVARDVLVGAVRRDDEIGAAERGAA